MQVQKLNNSVYSNQNGAVNSKSEHSINANSYGASQPSVQADTVAFKGGADFAKRAKNVFVKLSNYMKEPSEMTNALIAAIGTGAIAPFAIMCSPSKNANTPEEKHQAREKKKFQAIRQPVSALLAFGFQFPTTIGIAKGLNKLAYEKHIKLFDDEVLGQLIPDKKYLKKQARQVLENKADILTRNEWAEELKLIENSEGITREIIDKIKQENEGIEIAEDKLKRMANDKSRRLKYLSEKMANAKSKSLLAKKAEELLGSNFDMSKITDEALVTSGYKEQAKNLYKEEFKALQKDANLNWFDKVIQAMGFSNKKLNELSKKENELAQEKGLALIKQDIADKKIPDIFKDKTERLKNFVENRNIKAQKLYGNKIFWLTLCTNLVMVAISCVALNWLHPKFAKFVENIQQKKDSQNSDKKVEVRA